MRWRSSAGGGTLERFAGWRPSAGWRAFGRWIGYWGLGIGVWVCHFVGAYDFAGVGVALVAALIMQPIKDDHKGRSYTGEA